VTSMQVRPVTTAIPMQVMVAARPMRWKRAMFATATQCL
jgi:hypothetical protein